MNCTYLKGLRVVLRPLEMDDIHKLLQWVNDPEVRRHLGRVLPVSEEQERAWLSQQGQDATQVVLGIQDEKSGKLIGNTGLHGINWIDRTAEWGILIGEKEQQGRGYGTEACLVMLDYAFNTLYLHTVQLRVHADNARGIRCYERVGFRRAGTLRQAVFREGRHQDAHLYDMLRTEFPGLEKGIAKHILPHEARKERTA
jgi:RimJ/RimL family protein N-acetyltransferase